MRGPAGEPLALVEGDGAWPIGDAGRVDLQPAPLALPAIGGGSLKQQVTHAARPSTWDDIELLDLSETARHIESRAFLQGQHA